MPLKFEDLGSVGIFAKKLQNKLEGRKENEQESQAQYLGYGQRPQEQGYLQPNQHTPQYGHDGYQQHLHYQHQQHHALPQHGHHGYLSPHPPPHHGPHSQQPFNAQYPPRPLSSPPFQPEPYRQMESRTPQPYASPHGPPFPHTPSFRPIPGHHGLPPGTHIDSKTGKVQTDMFPPDYDGPLRRR